MSDEYKTTYFATIVRDTLARWLEKKDWSIVEFHRLLQGDDWPPTGVDDEPFSHFVQALGLLGPDYQVEFADRLARVLDQKPEEQLLASRPQQILYNLLRLCSEIYRPETLAPPLRRMWERRRLVGDWRGAKLRDRLRSALMLNQCDNVMEPVWRAMVGGSPNDFLAGNVAQGFYGLLLMKPVNGVDPDLAALGFAIGKVAEHLAHAGDARNFLLKQFLDRLCTAYPNREWDADFLNLAAEYDWSPWTITSLPSVAVRSNGHALVLSSVGKGMEKAFGCKVERMMVRDLISEVAVGQNEDAKRLVAEFSKQARVALREMKDLNIPVWLEATNNAFVYLQSMKSSTDTKVAVNIAKDFFRQHERSKIASTS